MKIAVLLTGLSYKKEGYTDRDWKLTANNIKENIIDCWIEDSTDVYLTTYDNNDNTELLDFYKPKKFNILNYKGSDQRLTYIKSLELLLNEPIDFIISTRFDIHFKEKLCYLNINFDKFNFLFNERGWEHKKFVTDNLFMFPKKYLNDFISVIQCEYETPARSNCSDLHNLYNRLSYLGENNINVISPTNELSNDNSFYKLIRI